MPEGDRIEERGALGRQSHHEDHGLACAEANITWTALTVEFTIHLSLFTTCLKNRYYRWPVVLVYCKIG